VEHSSPPIKIPSRKRKQPDIHFRLPAAAQTVGLKHSMLSEFLDLFGIHPGSPGAWQSVSDITFDAGL